MLIAIVSILAFSSFSLRAQVGIETVIQVLEGKKTTDPMGEMYSCLQTEGIESFKNKFCSDEKLHRSHPYGALKIKLDQKVADYLTQIGNSPLDKKFLSWLEVQKKACDQTGAQEGKSIAELAQQEYKNTLLNAPVSGERNDALFLASNKVLPVQDYHPRFSLPGEGLSHLSAEALDFPGTSFSSDAKRLAKRQKELQAELYKEFPELLVGVTLKSFEKGNSLCHKIEGLEFLFTSKVTPTLSAYLPQDEERMTTIVQDCKAIDQFPNLQEHMPPGSVASFDGKVPIDYGRPEMEVLSALGKGKTTESSPFAPKLRIDWDFEKYALNGSKVEKTEAPVPFNVYELVSKGVISREQIDRFKLALERRKIERLRADELTKKALLDPKMKTKIKEFTDEVLNLEAKMEQEKLRRKEIGRAMYGVRPPIDESTCEGKLQKMREDYARAQVYSELYQDPETLKRTEGMVQKAKDMVSESIDRMKISPEGKAKLKERLAAVKNLPPQGLPGPKKLEVFFDAFLKTKTELASKNIFDQNDLDRNLAREFGPKVLGAESWDLVQQVGATYDPASHSLNLNAPFLLPETQDASELSILHALTHELGHGLDENFKPDSCKDFKVPQTDANTIESLRGCSSLTKYKEDFADFVANESLGILLEKNLGSVSQEKKTALLNQILSWVCSPRFDAGDEHSMEKVRGERLFYHPRFKGFLSEQGISVPSDEKSSCVEKLWERE